MSNSSGVYPSAERLLEHGDQASLYLHRSFRSSWDLILVLAGSIYGVVSAILVYGESYRWSALVPCALVVVLLHRFLNDLYVINRDKIVHQAGRVSLRYSVPSIRCVDLRAINVNQSLIGRIFNYGNIELCTAAQAGAEVTVTGIVAPRELARLIDDLRVASQAASQDNRESAPTSSSGGVGND